MIDLFARLIELLEELFPDGWLASQAAKNRDTHVAVQQWSLCTDIVNHGAIRFPDHEARLHEIGRILLDARIWIRISDGDLQRMTIGSLSTYGDDRVLAKLRSRVRDPSQFDSLLVELSIGAWLLGEGWDVQPLEDPGKPDLRAEFPGLARPVFVECKCLKSLTANNVRKRIRKANKQLKAVEEESWGVLYLYVNRSSIQNESDDDEVPPEISELAELVGVAIRGPKNRSVTKVILVWDDHAIVGQDVGRPLVVHRRCFLTLAHTAEEVGEPMPDSISLFEGYSTVILIVKRPRDVQIRRVQISPLCANESIGRLLIPQAAIEQTTLEPQSDDWFVFQDRSVLGLFARRVAVDGSDGFLVSCAAVRGEAANVLWALWVDASLAPNVGFLSPVHMVSEFAHAFGLDMKVGNAVGRFVHFAEVDVDMTADRSEIITVMSPDDRPFFQTAIVRMVDDGPRHKAQVALCFCVDLLRYQTPWQ